MKTTRTLLAEYLHDHFSELEDKPDLRDIDIAISNFEDANGEQLDFDKSEEFSDLENELNGHKEAHNNNADILNDIESRLFPLCRPAESLASEDLAFICEQFRKLDY